MTAGDSLYAWQVQESDGRWSMVGALVPQTGTHQPLIHRRLDIVERFGPLARAHAEGTGQPLRLARFDLTEVLQ
jgi:hypothetical protein